MAHEAGAASANSAHMWTCPHAKQLTASYVSLSPDPIVREPSLQLITGARAEKETPKGKSRECFRMTGWGQNAKNSH
jgi:hypothetical protein